VTDALIGSAYGSAGERCMAISAAVAVGGVGQDVIDLLKPRVEALKIGPALDADSEMGPLITAEHRARVKGYVDMGIEEGAELVVDGRDYICDKQGYENGFYFGGCLFDKVTQNMKSYQDEIFGPVLQVLHVEDFDAAIKLPNEHEFGNGTAIFTRDGDAAREYADKVEVGMVGINVPIPVPLSFHTFGGWKDSAFGDLNQHGEAGVRFYTKTKTITSRWPKGIRAGAEFVIPTLND
jgi:malonate-semialdehyde dehydrogenase (acetylating)/methylmalonate-semialdehyde dehydrogenase